MFAQATKTVEVGPITVTIRKLSAKSLEKASEVMTERQLKTAKSAGPEVLRAIQEARERGITAGNKTTESKYGQFDRSAVLQAGITGWVAPKELNVPEYPAGIEQIDEESAELLHRAILDFSIPTKEQAAAEGKVA